VAGSLKKVKKKKEGGELISSLENGKLQTPLKGDINRGSYIDWGKGQKGKATARY